MTITTPGPPGADARKRTYRQVITIPTANGVPLPDESGNSSGSSSGGTSKP